MSEFFKHVAGKLAGTAFDLYKHQTIRKYRGQMGDEFAKAIRSVAKGSRWFLWLLIMLVPFLAAGFLLLAFGLFAIVYGVAPEAQKGLVCIVGGAIFMVVGLLCFLVPIVGVWVCTSESFVRARLDADKWENQIRGRSR